MSEYYTDHDRCDNSKHNESGKELPSLNISMIFVDVGFFDAIFGIVIFLDLVSADACFFFRHCQNAFSGIGDNRIVIFQSFR